MLWFSFTALLKGTCTIFSLQSPIMMLFWSSSNASTAATPILVAFTRSFAAGLPPRWIWPESLIDLLKLKPLLNRGIENLSGGEKQRISLGKAILSSPRLLLMDEPLTALDDTLRYQIISYLITVSEEFMIPYIFISHSLTEMQLMTESVLVINNGRLVEETTPEGLAWNRMATSQNGYLNLLPLTNPVDHNGLFDYRWGNNTLQV